MNNKWKKNIDGSTKTLKLKISVNKDNEARVSVAELIEKQLEEIGIEVTVEKVSADQYGKYIEQKNYQILLTGVYNSYSPDLTYYFAGGNISNYSNDEMFELVQNAGIIKESKQLKAIYERIYSIYKEEVPFIGLYRNKNITLSSQNLIGTVEPNNYTTFYGLENWYRKAN
ncbi:MAG: ABC transporter substrate-binding protein [Clostridia bacterium]